jgi:hypothetical protein
MSRAGFAIASGPDREELINSFREKTPVKFVLKPLEFDKEFGPSLFSVILVIEALKEPSGSPLLSDTILFEGSRRDKYNHVVYISPVEVRDWSLASGMFNLVEGTGTITLRSEEGDFRLLKEILEEDHLFNRFLHPTSP